MTELLCDGSDLVAEYDGAGNLIRRYVHAPSPGGFGGAGGPGVDEPLVWYEGAGTASRRWLHADERGSVIAMSSSTGASLATWRHGPHGESSDPAFTRFRFTGQMTLPGTPLHHFKARAYAPDLGRFLQPDPIGQAGGLNLYSYAGNDPVNFTDPSGLSPCEKLGDCPTNSKDGFKDDPVGGGVSKGFSQGAFTMVFAGIDPPEPTGRFFPDPFGFANPPAPPAAPPMMVMTGGDSPTPSASRDRSFDATFTIGVSADLFVFLGFGLNGGLFFDTKTGEIGLFGSGEIGVGLDASLGINLGIAPDPEALSGGFDFFGGGVSFAPGIGVETQITVDEINRTAVGTFGTAVGFPFGLSFGLGRGGRVCLINCRKGNR